MNNGVVSTGRRRSTVLSGKTVVVFGGSFDPVTLTHVQLAAEIVNLSLADEVWMVPCGARSDKHGLVDPQVRLHLLELALESVVPPTFPVFIDSTEVDQKRYIPTRELMNIYRARCPGTTFKALIGSDLLPTLHLWDDFPQLITENVFLVYERICSTCLVPNQAGQVELNDAARTRLTVERVMSSSTNNMCPMVSNISSTEIRYRIASKGLFSITGLTPLSVMEYIREHQLYGLKPTNS